VWQYGWCSDHTMTMCSEYGWTVSTMTVDSDRQFPWTVSVWQCKCCSDHTMTMCCFTYPMYLVSSQCSDPYIRAHSHTHMSPHKSCAHTPICLPISHVLVFPFVLIKIGLSGHFTSLTQFIPPQLIRWGCGPLQTYHTIS
jgi:hypothetical protein